MIAMKDMQSQRAARFGLETSEAKSVHYTVVLVVEPGRV
jgi:hypothetical protein